MSTRRLIREKRDSANQEVGELRRENDRLTRQVARLRREIERLQGLKEDGETSPTAKEYKKPTCPKCGSTNLGQFQTPTGKKVTACRSCKEWRTKPA